MSHRTRGRQRRPHPAGQQQLLELATRRGPAADCGPIVRQGAVGSELPDARRKPISFADMAEASDAEDWALSTGDAYASARDMHTALDSAAEVCLDIEVELVRMACAMSDVAVATGGKHALRMLFAPKMHLLEQLSPPAGLVDAIGDWIAEAAVRAVDRFGETSTYDHRPLHAKVGYEL